MLRYTTLHYFLHTRPSMASLALAIGIGLWQNFGAVRCSYVSRPSILNELRNLFFLTILSFHVRENERTDERKPRGVWFGLVWFGWLVGWLVAKKKMQVEKRMDQLFFFLSFFF